MCSANAQFVTTMACLSKRSDWQMDTTILLSNSACIQVSSSVWRLLIVPLVVPNSNKLYAVLGILVRTYLKFSIQFSIGRHHMLILLLSGCFDEDLFGFPVFLLHSTNYWLVIFWSVLPQKIHGVTTRNRLKLNFFKHIFNNKYLFSQYLIERLQQKLNRVLMLTAKHADIYYVWSKFIL